MDADLAFAGALEQRRLILAKEVSPRELAELYIERLDERLHSFLTVTRERALRAAQAAEDTVMRGAPLGPLHGVPVSIKDTADTRAVRTTKGSLIFRNHVPDADALPVERILAAGAVMLGKSNCPEFGLIGDTTNGLGEPCRNPWNTGRSPGGSTGGGAAAVRRRWPRDSAPCRRAATAVAPFAVRRASAVSTASSRPWGGCRTTPAPACRRR